MTTNELKSAEKLLRSNAERDSIKHLSTGAAVFDNQGQVLMVRRIASDFMGGLYEIPGGGVEEGEQLFDAVTRELAEETGLSILGVDSCEAAFDYESPEHGTTRQINFVVHCGSGSQIQLNPSEHDAFRWVSREELPTLQMSVNMRRSINRLYDSVASL